MRSSIGKRHVPAFLIKLWKLVQDPSCADLISWSESGKSFIIHNDVQFANELLPMYFKHNHMASFVRQLNMYGFRKLNHVEYGGMHCTSNEIEFHHQYFIREEESLLKMIKRKVSHNKMSHISGNKQGCMREVSTSIDDIKDNQQNTEKIVKELRQQNQLLWKQLSIVNHRCMKQERLLTELVPIFIDMVQPNPSLPNKRKSHLMIDDGSSINKVVRFTPQYLSKQEPSSPDDDYVPSSPFSISNSGPVIRDVTEMEMKPYAEDVLRCLENPKEGEGFVDSPFSSKLRNMEQKLESPFTNDVMERFNIINFRPNNVAVENEALQEQSPATMAAINTSTCIPFPTELQEMQSAATNPMCTLNSLSVIGLPPLSNSSAVASDTCHDDFSNGNENIPARKSVSDSFVTQRNILSNSLISDSCLNIGEDAASNDPTYPGVINICSSTMLLPTVAASTVAPSTILIDHLSLYNGTMDVNQSFATHSPSIATEDPSCHSESHSGEHSVKVELSVGTNDVMRNNLNNIQFDENATMGPDCSSNWPGNSDSGTASNIDNWFGQLLKSEGLITGSELNMVPFKAEHAKQLFVGFVAPGWREL